MDFKNTNSKWIWNGNKGVNQYAAFRQKVFLDSTKNVKCLISCDTNYMLWVNGTFVDCGQYLAMPQHKYYDALPISNYVKEGENTIAVLVYYQGVGTQCYSKGIPGLIYAIKTESGYISNEGAIVSNEVSGYVEGEMPLISMQLGPSFEFDARGCQTWTEMAYIPDHTWRAAVIQDFCTLLPRNIAARPIKKLDLSERENTLLINEGKFLYSEKDTLVADKMMNAYMTCEYVEKKPRQVIRITEDHTYILLDFGKETAGYFEIEMTAPENVTVDVAYGEHLREGRVSAKIHTRNFAFRHTSKKGKNAFVHYFRRIAGRYLQLNFSNVTGEILLHYAGVRKAIYPVTLKKAPALQDELHKKIYQSCVETLRLCMHEHYEDTPWREQCLYGLDSRNQALFGYYAMGDKGYYQFAKASFDLLGSTIGEDGFVKMTAPSDMELIIPSFGIMWIVEACEYVFFSKDLKTGKRYFLMAENAIDKIMRTMENGIVLIPMEEKYWNFYDWSEGLDGIQDNRIVNLEDYQYCCVYNLMICYALKNMIKLGNLIRQDVRKLQSSYRNLKESINRVFYDAEQKLYKTYLSSDHTCQLAQALAVCSGVAPDARRLRQWLVADTSLVKTTLCTMVFKYEALLGDKKYHKAIMEEIAAIWGDMLYRGASTFYETQLGADDFDGAGSLCHGWSAVPIYVYNRIAEMKK